MKLTCIAVLASSLLATSLAFSQNTHLIADADPASTDVPQTSSSAPQSAAATAATPTPTAETICGITHLVRCIQDLGEDDKGVFTSPLRTKPQDAYWLAPLGAATGLAIAYDSAAQRALGYDQNRNNIANNISTAGEFWVAGGESASIYFLGLGLKRPKLAETGRLAAETILVSGTVTGALKLATNRERPNNDIANGQGYFWKSPPTGYTWDSSFPSGHATASMALARVVAGEYPHWYVMIPAYGFAETVSICRVLGQDHFPSDVLVGQTIGFLTGTYVLNHRALYRPGKKGVAERMLRNVSPIMDARTHSIGASISIPTGR